MKLFWIFFLVLPLAAAPVRVALIGDGNAVDRLTVYFSQQSGIVLMERSAVEKILQEQKLTVINGAELIRRFSHVDVIGMVFPSSVEFFNAKNGFKLARLSMEEAFTENRLRQIIDKSVSPDAQMLSVGFVNLTDIPLRERSKVGRIVMELESVLVNMAEIQLLERDHLSAILRERELSETRYSLTPSSKIIRCEFAQGSDAGKIDLELTLSDPAGKVLFRKKYAALDGGAVPAGDIGVFLNGVPSRTVAYDRRNEAKRYFEEYYAAIRRLDERPANIPPRNFGTLWKYVDAMYVLEPENPRYCYEKIFYELCFATNPWLSWREKVKILQKFVLDAQKFRKEFPDFRFPGHDNGGNGFRYHPVISVQPINNIFQHNGKAPSAAEAEELSRLNDEIHAIHRAIYAQFSSYYLDDAAKINTLNDLQHYLETRRVFLDLMPHFDAVKAVRLAWRAEQEELAAIRDFMQKHPEQAQKAPRHHWYFPYLFEMRGIWRKREAWQTVRNFLNHDFDKLEKLIRKIRFKQYNYHLLELAGLRDYLNSDGSEAAFQACFAKMIQSFVEQENFRPAPNTIYGHNLRDAAVQYFQLDHRNVWNFILTYPCEYLLARSELTEKERGIYAIHLMKNDAPASLIRKLALTGICDNAVGNRIQHFANQLFREPTANLERLKELNRAFQIQNYPLPKTASPSAAIKFCCGATLHDGMIYLLYEDKTGAMRFFRFDPEKRKIAELPAPEIKGRDFQAEMRGHGQSGQIALQGFGNLIFAGGQKSIGVYDLKTEKWKFLRDLPGEYIVGIHWDGKRIFYLCGGDGMSLASFRHLSMHSCKLDGSERKTYFNGKSGKSLFGASGSGSASGLFPVSQGKLLFTLAPENGQGHLVAFEPATEEFESLRKFPISGATFSLRRNGDFLLGEDGPFFGCSFFKLNPQYPEAEVELFFTQYSGDRRKFRHRINGYHSIQHPAVLVKDRYLANAGHGFGNWFLDVKHPEQSPLLLLPTCVSVFYLPEHDEFIYPGFYQPTHDIYVVKLKEPVP